MKYERLTMINNGFIDTNCRNCKQCKKVGRKYICNDMTACNEEIITRLAELEDKIERGELVENTVVTYVNMGKSGSKTLVDKALKYDALKAKIENGTLIELPCKVGDTVWGIVTSTDRTENIITYKHIQKYQVERIVIDGNNLYLVILVSTKDGIYEGYARPNQVYYTKAEAEAKLKELKGE